MPTSSRFKTSVIEPIDKRRKPGINVIGTIPGLDTLTVRHLHVIVSHWEQDNQNREDITFT